MRFATGKLSIPTRLLVLRLLILAATVSAVSVCRAADNPSPGAQPQQATESGLYMKVQLNEPIKLSTLKPGESVEGKLARDVYSADRELWPRGIRVRLVVDHLEKRRRARNDHWPWVVNAFTPRHESYPVFQTAIVSAAGGESAVRVALVSVSHKREVRARSKKTEPNGKAEGVAPIETGNADGPPNGAPTMVLEAFGIEYKTLASLAPSPDESALEALPAGTACKILLLGDVSASKSQAGDMVQARLIEPVLLNGQVILPAGTFFEGKVVKKTPPRWGSRAGSLYLTFTGLKLPGGNLVPISASLVGAELDRRSHTRIDAEGRLRGERPGAAWMAINIGVTAGLAKEVDDTTQLIIEAIVSSATDVSTAGTSRIVASCISGIYMVSRRGRDVVLPRFTEMDIALDRPLSIEKSSTAETVKSNANGN